MTKHIHADLMLQYAQDAAETDKPWLLWEIYNYSREDWTTLDEHPRWAKVTLYRKKPATVMVNGIEVPAPIKDKLKLLDLKYYLPNINDPGRPHSFMFRDDGYDNQMLKAGLLYLSSEDAEARAKAMLITTAV